MAESDSEDVCTVAHVRTVAEMNVYADLECAKEQLVRRPKSIRFVRSARIYTGVDWVSFWDACDEAIRDWMLRELPDCTYNFTGNNTVWTRRKLYDGEVKLLDREARYRVYALSCLPRMRLEGQDVALNVLSFLYARPQTIHKRKGRPSHAFYMIDRAEWNGKI